jgi:hypothetical protein
MNYKDYSFIGLDFCPIIKLGNNLYNVNKVK